MACLVTSREKVTIDQLNSQLFRSTEPVKIGDRDFYMLNQQPGMVILSMNARRRLVRQSM